MLVSKSYRLNYAPYSVPGVCHGQGIGFGIRQVRVRIPAPQGT